MILESILKSVPDMAIATTDLDFRITNYNHQAETFFGYTAEEVIGKTVQELHIDEHVAAERFEQAIEIVRRTGEYCYFLEQKTDEGLRYLESRVVGIFDSDKKLAGFALFSCDVSKRKKAEEREQQYRIIMEASLQGMYQVDVNNCITFANPAISELTGYSLSELNGLSIATLFPSRAIKATVDTNIAILKSGKAVVGENIMTRKDGSTIETYFSCVPVICENAEYAGFIGSILNITEYKKLEVQYRQSQKLEAIGQLAGGIAHDFNNILGAILGYAEMAERQLPESSPVREDVAEIVVAGQRAVELVKQILTFSRQENEKFKPVKVQNIVQEILKLLRASLPVTIHLEQMIDTSCKPILGDPTQLHQVLLNLCTNAKHALGDSKGSISVLLKQRETGYLDIEVTDNGCGMDRQTMERIFDPFFTTKPKGQGTGLGLSVSYGIIKQHGGEINVESSPGKGTTFVISLPTVESEADWALAVEQKETPRGSEHIVLVDDEKNLIDIVERMLSSLGYTVTSFSDSQQALAWMQDHLADFDLLLTDMTMPIITGGDLTKKLLALRPELPIILCTGFSETLNKEQAIALGIREYLLKPVTKQQLASKLCQVLHTNTHDQCSSSC